MCLQHNQSTKNSAIREREFPVLGTKDEEMHQDAGRQYVPHDQFEVRINATTTNFDGLTSGVDPSAALQ